MEVIRVSYANTSSAPFVDGGELDGANEGFARGCGPIGRGCSEVLVRRATDSEGMSERATAC